jgi:hypothetical protein
MMTNCPYCGRQLPDRLRNGVGFCSHCARVYTTTPENQVLSAGWWLLGEEAPNYDRFVFETGLADAEARRLWNLIVEQGVGINQLVRFATPDAP